MWVPIMYDPLSSNLPSQRPQHPRAFSVTSSGLGCPGELAWTFLTLTMHRTIFLDSPLSCAVCYVAKPSLPEECLEIKITACRTQRGHTTSCGVNVVPVRASRSLARPHLGHLQTLSCALRAFLVETHTSCGVSSPTKTKQRQSRSLPEFNPQSAATMGNFSRVPLSACCAMRCFWSCSQYTISFTTTVECVSECDALAPRHGHSDLARSSQSMTPLVPGSIWNWYSLLINVSTLKVGVCTL